MEKEDYQTTYDNERAYWWYQARAEIVEHVFRKRVLTRNAHILNLGCGTGLISQRFAKYGFILGLDQSADALGFCARNALTDLARADAASLPLRDSCFDACLAFDVIEHVRDHLGVVAEISRVLKPGGQLILTVPAFQWMWSDMDDHGHFRRYNKTQVNALLSGAGLRATILSYYNFFLFPLALIQRFKERIFQRKKVPGDFLPALPPVINRLFFGIFQAEKELLGRMPLPFGLSILALARKE